MVATWIRLGLFTFVSGFLFAIAWYSQSHSSWFLLCCVGLLWAMMVIALVVPSAYRGQRIVHDQQVVVHLQVGWHCVLPWIAIDERWQDHEKQEAYAFRNVLFPMFRRKLVYTYSLPPFPRGCYRSEGIDVHAGDLFGLAIHKRWVSMASTWIVYPKTKAIVNLALYDPDHNEPNLRVAKAQSELGFLRSYKRGDPLRQIDWKATARMDKWMIRPVPASRMLNRLVVLDVEKRVDEHRDASVFEAAVSCAASLLTSYKHARIPAMLATSDRSEPIRCGESDDAAMARLATVSWKVRTVPLARAIDRLAPWLTEQVALVIVTVNDDVRLSALADQLDHFGTALQIWTPHLQHEAQADDAGVQWCYFRYDGLRSVGGGTDAS